MEQPSRVKEVPERWGANRLDEHLRKIARGVNQGFRGKGNNAYRVTLRPDKTQTILSVSFAREGGVALLQPETASAAAAAGKVFAVVRNGQVEITHDQQSGTDRTFAVVLFG